MGSTATRHRLLSDVLVVDLSRALAGPHATMMLADLGARVIKVEQPGSGDDSRGWGPPFVGSTEEPLATYFLSCNRNKRSVVLDLKRREDVDTLLELVDRADVLVENFRSGVLERLGLAIPDLRRRNPRLIVLSMTGFGHDGPMAERPGYDQIVQGESGLMSLTGAAPDEPLKTGIPVSDLFTGMYGAFGVVAALHERNHTGEGGVVRTSLLAASIGAHTFQGARWTVGREVPAPTGNHHAAIAPYGMFRCADGHIQIAVATEAQWEAFASAIGLEASDGRWRTNGDRLTHRDDLVAAIETAFADRSRTELLKMLDELGIPAGRVATIDEVYASEVIRSQGLLIEVEHPVLGRLQLPGPPLRFDGRDADPHEPPPLLGEHTEEIRAWIGRSA
ncbi:CaiB/BaiF CoA transferase family protein [Actinomadura sp. LOL_016]|uniref:CaiB/BaiF CoA transferase family protein n=1 Tax=unclassified Actinomadura TaxID=2626254 RepID=UPI003A7F8A27